jgi:hypothetical protein
MNAAADILSSYHTYQLNDEKNISLMRRIDCKYIFHFNHLTDILIQFADKYRRLDIDDELIPVYDTLYYDTPDFQMYTNHHNGKADRYKIRHRLYVSSNKGFLEVKHKNNLSIVKKTRIGQNERDDLSKNMAFISAETPYTYDQLKPSISTCYKRITLADFESRERVTIDCNLVFKFRDKSFEAENLVICEIKKNPGGSRNEFENYLLEKRIKPFTMSKYCLGNYYLNDTVKQNLFKEKAIYINKIISTK